MADTKTIDASFFTGVADKHPEYTSNVERWRKNRIICSGSDEVKRAGTLFLPQLGAQDTTEYDAYKQRANFFPAAKKTISSIVGMIHAKAPVVTFPKSKLKILEEIGLDDASISEISMKINYEQALQGRVGLLTDYESGATGQVSPYITTYVAESIWNWKEAKIQGRTRLAMVVLCEHVPKDEGNMFCTDTVEQLRVLWLDKDDGYLKVALLKATEDSKGGTSGFALVDEVREPVIRGKHLDYIPFRIVGAQSIAASVEESPVESIVDTNISHYITAADLEHGRHYTALPTYYLVADTTDDPQLTVGGPSFIHIKTIATEAEVGILEYKGQGLGSLERADEQKKHEMAVLGARMLQTEKKQAEAVDTVRLRQASENSIVSNMARTASRALTESLKWVAEILTLSGKVSFELTTDFLTISIDPKMVDSLAALVANDRMSLESFYYNLAQGGLYPDGHSFTAESEMIDRDSTSGKQDKDKDVMDLDNASDDKGGEDV